MAHSPAAPNEIVSSAYECLDRGDIDGLLGVLGDALVAIPGATRISGDHTGPAVGSVATELIAAVAGGRLRREPVCTYEAPSGVVAVFDNLVRPDGGEDSPKYHTAEEWIFRDGTLVALMVYVHEYDLFAQFWS